jgi:hypothetical protein
MQHTDTLPEITILPRRTDGRVNWQEFFSGVKPGDVFILSAACIRGISTAARINAVATRQHNNQDGTFTLTIVEPFAGERMFMLKALGNLSHSQLKALYQAGVKAGMFA